MHYVHVQCILSIHCIQLVYYVIITVYDYHERKRRKAKEVSLLEGGWVWTLRKITYCTRTSHVYPNILRIEQVRQSWEILKYLTCFRRKWFDCFTFLKAGWEKKANKTLQQILARQTFINGVDRQIFVSVFYSDICGWSCLAWLIPKIGQLRPGYFCLVCIAYFQLLCCFLNEFQEKIRRIHWCT